MLTDFPNPVTILRGRHAGKLAWSRGPVAMLRPEITRVYIRVKGQKMLVNMKRDNLSDETQPELL